MSEHKNDEQLAALSLAAFLEALAGASAAPGGGAATAVAGALGAALAAMVARLTVGRPRYAGAEAAMTQMCAQADALRGRLLALAGADSDAYTALMASYRLPWDTAEQKSARAAAIQAALRGAIEVPLATAAACAETLALAAQAAEHGNHSAAGDAAVAALLAHAGLLGAAHNVRLNLRGVEDVAYGAEIAARVDELTIASERVLGGVLHQSVQR